jgi:SAM-dependent methyltransferase
MLDTVVRPSRPYSNARRFHARTLTPMTEPTGLRQYAQVFDRVAADYDAHRPGYPDAIVDVAVQRGELAAGARVLEVGCGTGKLTELLAARGLQVDAVDPGEGMIATARRRVGDATNVRFHHGRFEDVALPEDAYDAVFSATAFHWVEPEVGWEKAAAHLRDRGLLALLVYAGVSHDGSEVVDREFRAVLEEHVPELVDGWPPMRDLDTLLRDARAARANVSAVWDSIMFEGTHGLTVDAAAALFEHVEVDHVLTWRDWTADELIALHRTTSLHARIPDELRSVVEEGDREVAARHGGSVRWWSANALVTARRVPR